jgi:hypothetical protein
VWCVWCVCAVISASSAREAVRFSYEWKQPCLLTYTRVDVAARVPVPTERNPIIGAVYWNAPNIAALSQAQNKQRAMQLALAPKSFTPLLKEEHIGKGEVSAVLFTHGRPHLMCCAVLCGAVVQTPSCLWTASLWRWRRKRVR